MGGWGERTGGGLYGRVQDDVVRLKRDEGDALHAERPLVVLLAVHEPPDLARVPATERSCVRLVHLTCRLTEALVSNKCLVRDGSGFSPLDREDIETRAEVVSLLTVPRIVRRVNAVELAP